ncbi:hypothetical protein GCM10028803_00650 [Larkinella knui]|uniref:Cytochrome b561 domain-containing protein n=1 Tax=Larkinella knui TaxID=2025310 RepID=A0A3P1CMT0_9BACT|nr:hypothetical protein [Larkinella knui]RRB14224.1 hypothetical protein EHT87_18495 [Larkinella knui]
MRTILLITLLGLGSMSLIRAQTVPADTLAPVEKSDNLLADLDDSTSLQELLPHKMIITQRIFWGQKGLLRRTNLAPLTPEGRERELRIRRTMLVSHQVMGFITLAGFVAQGLVGAKLYNATGDQYGRLLNVHSSLAAGINLAYVTTALLSLTAPPKMIGERRGFSSIKLHKYLAVAHMAGMIATNILASSIENHPELKPYHRAAAYTTFGAFALSVVAIKF